MSNQNNDEIAFTKYQSQGAYHWEQISRSISRHNAYVSARYQAVLSEAGEIEGQSILDIGGGDGVLSYLIARRGSRPITLDVSPTGLRFARQEFGRRGLEARAVTASSYNLPFPTGTFDTAVCSDVIEHVQSPQTLLSEANRVLRPKGRFVLTTPLRVTESPVDQAHVREFFAGELETLLTSFFEEVTVRAFAPLSLLDLFVLPFRRLGERPLFRYLFNVADVYLGQNPFQTSMPFRYSSMLIASGHKS